MKYSVWAAAADSLMMPWDAGLVRATVHMDDAHIYGGGSFFVVLRDCRYAEGTI